MPAADNAAHVCGLTVKTIAVPEHPDELAFELLSDDEAAAVSGMLAIYAGGFRYRIPFVNVVAGDPRNVRVEPGPIVIRFPLPLRYESAYIASLNSEECAIRNPDVSGVTEVSNGVHYQNEPYPGWSVVEAEFQRHAASLEPINAPLAKPVDPPKCAAPYVAASTILAVRPNQPASRWTGDIILRLSIGDDGSLIAVRFEKSSNDSDTDKSAVDAVWRSRFASQIYRCEAIGGNFIYVARYTRR